VALLLAAQDDALFLQIKEAGRSVLERYTGTKPVEHNGQRVVVGQKVEDFGSRGCGFLLMEADTPLPWPRDAATGEPPSLV
jgi:hypothetical protein